MREYIVFSGGQYLDEKGSFGPIDYAKIIEDKTCGEWIAEYFDGILTTIENSHGLERAYFLGERENREFKSWKEDI